MKKNIILLVEDDELDVISVQRTLKKFYAECLLYTAYNGKEALAMLNDSSDPVVPDLILLDLNMPVISGWDFLDEVVQFEDDLKNAIHIYVVSSSGDPKDKTKALFYPNVVAFIIQPLTHNFIENQFKITS